MAKSKKKERKTGDSYVWTDDEVWLLLHVTLEYNGVKLVFLVNMQLNSIEQT